MPTGVWFQLGPTEKAGDSGGEGRGRDAHSHEAKQKEEQRHGGEMLFGCTPQTPNTWAGSLIVQAHKE